MADTIEKTISIPESVMDAENISVDIFTDELGEWQAGFSNAGLDHIAYGNRRYVATGSSDGVYYSDDGITWNAGISGLITDYNCIAYGNGRFVAFGYYYDSENVYMPCYSNDGIIWSNGIGCSVSIGEIAYGNGRFVAVGSSGVYYSDDGITWIAGSSIVYDDIAYGNGRFVAVGSNGASYSDDGITWTACTWNVGELVSLDLIAYGNRGFVAVGSSVAYYSDDGITWNTGGPTFSSTPKNVFFGKNKFVCVGNSGRGSNSKTVLYYSDDGITWTDGETPGITGTVDGLCINNKYVLVGSYSPYCYYAEFIKEQRILEEVINESKEEIKNSTNQLLKKRRAQSDELVIDANSSHYTFIEFDVPDGYEIVGIVNYFPNDYDNSLNIFISNVITPSVGVSVFNTSDESKTTFIDMTVLCAKTDAL